MPLVAISDEGGAMTQETDLESVLVLERELW
jgi:hypothetical protein